MDNRPSLRGSGEGDASGVQGTLVRVRLSEVESFRCSYIHRSGQICPLLDRPLPRPRKKLIGSASIPGTPLAKVGWAYLPNPPRGDVPASGVQEQAALSCLRALSSSGCFGFGLGNSFGHFQRSSDHSWVTRFPYGPLSRLRALATVYD